MTSIIDAQCQSESLRSALRQFTTSKVKPDLSGILELVISVPQGFSVAHILHDIMQFLKGFSKNSKGSETVFAAIVNQLISKFELSFRPGGREVLDLCKLYALENSACLGSMFVLLHKCLLNQHGVNPKQVFLLIVDDMFPFLDTLPEFRHHFDIIETIVGLLFSSKTNLSLLSVYLSLPSGKRRKISESYVGRLFDALSQMSNPLEISRMVLRSFVSNTLSEGFSFFQQIAKAIGDDKIECELWKTLSELHVYELRGSDSHRAALEVFFAKMLENPSLKWEGLHVVLQVDPVSFTDRIVALVNEEPNESCIQCLLKMFASKGSLCDGLKLLPFVSIPKNLEISPLDYVASLEVADLASLLKNETLLTLGPNLRPQVSEFLEERLKLVSYKNGDLVISLVDAIQVVKTAWELPTAATVNDEIVIHALSRLAAKNSHCRAAALVRLSVLTDMDITLATIRECKGYEAELEGFCAHPRNRSCLEFKIGLKPRLKRKDTVEEQKSDQYSDLMMKSAELISKFGNEMFVPPNLRKSNFPSEVLALESAPEWSRIIDFSPNLNLETKLYAMAVILGHRDLDESYTTNLLSANLLCQSRLLLAIHGRRPSRESAERLVILAGEILVSRDLHAIQCAYYCLYAGIITERDKRKVRLPWWTSKVHMLLPGLRGLLGATINAAGEEGKIEAANSVVRVWKTLVDSFSKEKNFRFTKSIPILAGEYIRLSHQVKDSECAKVLDKGCALLIEKLDSEEMKFFHAMLGKTDRETLKRINSLLETNFKYTGRA